MGDEHEPSRRLVVLGVRCPQRRDLPLGALAPPARADRRRRVRLWRAHVATAVDAAVGEGSPARASSIRFATSSIRPANVRAGAQQAGWTAPRSPSRQNHRQTGLTRRRPRCPTCRQLRAPATSLLLASSRCVATRGSRLASCLRRHRRRGLLPSMPDDKGKDVTRSSPLLIYTAHEAFMKPRVVPHNRPPQVRTNGNGRNAYDRACCGDRRRRSGGDDAGG